MKPLLDNLASGCNGMLAAQRWQITANQLLQFTASGSWEMTENYVGPTPAPLVPCNESQYGVGFEVTVGQGVQVPNVKNLSPNDAGNMLRAAGLVMNVAVTRHGGERPTVVDQTPQPGARIGRNEPVKRYDLDGKGGQQ